MVERPIKKSERQSNTNADTNSENLDSDSTTSPVESNPKVIKRNSDRGADSSERRSSGRGKKSSYGNESKPPVNPALARGPKPVKPKPNVVLEPEVEAESVSEESQDQATEG